jgi:carboxypeptidase C (cathepsin A)
MAEGWARDEYAPALKRLATLSDLEKDRIVAQLSRFTGLDQKLIDRQSLLVGRQQFAEQLLRDRKQVLARFDTRTFAGPPPAENRRDATINRYLRSDLKYKTDLAYLDSEAGYTPGGQRTLSVGARWSYDQAPASAVAPRLQNLDGPPGGSQPWIRRAMQINPALRVFVAAGLYDSLNSCAVNAALVPALEPALGANITARCYEGGHMMYEEPRVRSEMTRDVAAFLRRPL